MAVQMLPSQCSCCLPAAMLLRCSGFSKRMPFLQLLRVPEAYIIPASIATSQKARC